MLKKNLYAFGVALFIIVTLLLFNILLIFEDEGFVREQLEEQKATEKIENAFEIDKNIRGYLTTTSSLNTTGLSEREIKHLEDVKGLYNAGKTAVALFLFLIILSFFYKKGPKIWQQGVWVFGTVFSLFLISGLVANNFPYFFNLFHEVFFRNDLWILSPHHTMINIYPQQFFLNSFLVASQRTFFMGFVISILLVVISFFRINPKQASSDIINRFKNGQNSGNKRGITRRSKTREVKKPLNKQFSGIDYRKKLNKTKKRKDS